MSLAGKVFLLWRYGEIEAAFASRADAEVTAERVDGDVQEVALLPPGSGDAISPRLRCAVETYVYADGGPEAPISEHRVFVDKDAAVPAPTVGLSPHGYLHIWAAGDDIADARHRLRETVARVLALVREGLSPQEIVGEWPRD